MKNDQQFVMGKIIVNGEEVSLMCDGIGSRRYFVRHSDGSRSEDFDRLGRAMGYMKRTYGLDIIGSSFDWDAPVKLRPL